MFARRDQRAEPRSRRKRHASLSSFAYPNFTLYFVGQVISVAGSWMQNIAQAYLVLHLTNNGTDLGFLTGIRTAPIMILGPWGGLIVDRIDRRRMLLLTNLGSGILCSILAWVVIGGHPHIGFIYLIALGLGLIQVVDNPSRQVIISDLVPISELANAVSLNSVMVNVGRILGPSLAGITIAAFGIGTCFALNAASFFVAILTLLLIKARKLQVAVHAAREKGQIREGLRYVKGQKELYLTLMLLVVAGTFTWEFPVTVPLIAQRTFGGQPAVYGTLFTCMGIGAVIGGLVTASRPAASYRGLGYATLGWGASCFLAGICPTLALEYPVMVIVGYGSVAFNAISKTKLQTDADPAMRGRVMALWSVAWVGSTPIGGPIVGYIGQHLGPRWAWYTGGISLLIAGLLAMPALIRLDNKAAVAVASTVERTLDA